MEKTELLACPCCDSKAILVVNPYDEGFEAIIYCTGGAKVGCFMRSRHWAAKKSWAIKSAKDAWNHRAALPDNKALTVEELREMEDAVSYRKHMPMEVNEDGERFCPRCQEEIVGYYTEYCEHCGQAVESPPEKGE